jgi:hypothetical protein
MNNADGIFPLAETVPVRRNSARWTATKGPGFCDPVSRSLHVPDGATPGEAHIRVHELTHAYISPAKAKRPADIPEVAIQRAEDARCNAYDRAWGIGDLLHGMCSPEDVERLTSAAARDPRYIGGLREAITAAVSVHGTGDESLVADRLRDIYSGDDAWIADKILGFARSAATYMDRSAANLPNDGRKGWGSTIAVARKAERYAQSLATEILNPPPTQQPPPSGGEPQPQPQSGEQSSGEQSSGEQQQPQPDTGEQDTGEDAPGGDPQAPGDDETGDPGESPTSGDGDDSGPENESGDGDGDGDGEQDSGEAPGSGGEQDSGDSDGDEADDDLAGLFGGDPATDGDAAMDDNAPDVAVKIAPPVGAGGAGAGSELARVMSGGNDAVERQLGPLKDLAKIYSQTPRWPSDIPLWGKIEMQHPPLKLRLPAKVRGRRLRATDAGAVMSYAHRDESDGMIFAERGNKIGGATILIDCSGSTNITAEDVERILELAPAAIIATYAGGRFARTRSRVVRNGQAVDVDHSFGQLRIVAKGGRRCKPEQVLPGRYVDGVIRQQYGGNMVDGPALDWLNKQPGPRYWISDGKVVGNGSRTFDLFEDAIRKCRKGKVERIDSVRGLLEALKARKIKRR